MKFSPGTRDAGIRFVGTRAFSFSERSSPRGEPWSRLDTRRVPTVLVSLIEANWTEIAERKLLYKLSVRSAVRARDVNDAISRETQSQDKKV